MRLVVRRLRTGLAFAFIPAVLSACAVHAQSQNPGERALDFGLVPGVAEDRDPEGQGDVGDAPRAALRRALPALSDTPLRMQLAPGLTVATSPIHGCGCFATVPFARRKKIAEYTGERITNAEAERRGHRRILRISGLDHRWSIDGSRGGNGTHYINHSCRPTAYLQTIGRRLIVMALRDIEPGDEVTVDYVSSMHSDRKRCTCKAVGCRGTINKTPRRSPG